MKFVFDYEEILLRRIEIESSDLESAISKLHYMIDTEEIVLDSEDFAAAEVRMPLEKNFLPQLQKFGETVENVQGLDIVIDMW